MLERFGLTLPPSAVDFQKYRGSRVDGRHPPFVRSGSRIDVHVGDGGCPFAAWCGLGSNTIAWSDGTVYAVAQGPVAVGGFIGGIPGPGGASVQKNHPTSGQIVRGAVVEREYL